MTTGKVFQHRWWIRFEVSKCCHSWTPIQKKGEIPLWWGGVQEAQKAWSLRFTLKVFIWRHVVYVPKSSTTFRGILICVIVRSRDMQEYILMFILYSDLLILNTSFLSWTLMFIYFVYCIIGHLLQGSGMEQPLYKH
jgi:hypothetical protein